MHLLCRLVANTPNLFHLELSDEVQCPVGMDNSQTIRFTPVGCYLCQELAVTYSRRSRQSSGLQYALLDFPCNVHRPHPLTIGAHHRLILRHVQKRLVKRDRLYQVRIVVKDFVQLRRHLLIPLEMWLYDDELRTETFGHLYGLCRMDTKTTCLIAGRRHYATLCVVSDSYRFAFQFWIVTLFYSCKELIHVHMNNLHRSKGAK